MEKAPRHPEVNQEYATALESNNQILAASPDALDSLALQLGRHLGRLVGTYKAWVGDPNAVEASPEENGLERPADGLDLRQLRHG
jgi:hypothetical protein